MLKTLAILLATLAVTTTAFHARLRSMHDHHDEKRWRPPHLAQMFTGKRNVDEGAVGDNGFIRFGKRSSHTPGNEFIRFGKKNDGEPGDNGFIRFGKRSDVGNEFIRFGKKTGAGNEFIRFGKSEGPDNQFIRFG